jgi:hypothetical protein
MSSLLLNLRYVPDDEADEIRGWLASNDIDYYETAPSRWGISAGAIWIRHDHDAERAYRLMADYQRERRERLRAALADARRDGTAPTFWSALRENPRRMLVVLLAIACVLGLASLPALLLFR